MEMFSKCPGRIFILNLSNPPHYPISANGNTMSLCNIVFIPSFPLFPTSNTCFPSISYPARISPPGRPSIFRPSLYRGPFWSPGVQAPTLPSILHILANVVCLKPPFVGYCSLWHDNKTPPPGIKGPPTPVPLGLLPLFRSAVLHMILALT